ncbi:MAG: hypothetical protein WD534_13045 [Phycisphaeraceae bacterium]
MKRMLAIQLRDDSTDTLEELGRRQHRRPEEVAQDILERAMSLARMRKLRDELRPQAEATGFKSEDDILDAIS